MKLHLTRFWEWTPSRGFALILSLGLVLWGCWVGNPYVDTFEAGFYSLMAELAAEGVWAALFLVAGLTMGYGVVRKKPESVRTGAFLGFMLWLFVSVLYGLSDPTVTPTATNFVLALAHAWLWVTVKTRPEVLTQAVLVLDGGYEVTIEELAQLRRLRVQQIKEKYAQNLDIE